MTFSTLRIQASNRISKPQTRNPTGRTWESKRAPLFLGHCKGTLTLLCQRRAETVRDHMGIRRASWDHKRTPLMPPELQTSSGRLPFPKGPCTSMVYTRALKGFLCSSFRAQVYTLWGHAPLGFVLQTPDLRATGPPDVLRLYKSRFSSTRDSDVLDVLPWHCKSRIFEQPKLRMSLCRSIEP